MAGLRQVLQAHPVQPYADGWEHYADEMRWLDLCLRAWLERNRADEGDPELQPFKGLVMSEQEADSLLNEADEGPPAGERLKWLERSLRLRERIDQRRRRSREADVYLPLDYVSEVYRLTPFEERCVMLGLAVELNRKYERLFGYVQDDVTSRLPTIDLALNLICSGERERLAARALLSPSGKLFRSLLRPDEEREKWPSLLALPLRLDERLVSFLLSTARIDARLSDFARLEHPQAEPPELLWGGDMQRRLREFAASRLDASGPGTERGIALLLRGNAGAGKSLQARHLARHFGQPALLVDVRRMSRGEPEFRRQLQCVMREVVLQQALLAFVRFDELLGEADVADERLRLLLEALRDFRGIVLLLSRKRWTPPEPLAHYEFLAVELGIPEDAERKRLWERLADGYSLDGRIDWTALSGQFQFTCGQMEQALRQAERASAWRGSGEAEERPVIRREELLQACYAQVQHSLEKKAKRIRPNYTWRDLILPDDQLEQLHHACGQVKYRHIVYGQWGFGRKLSYGKGLSMLFAGPPGTGKTMSAEVVAGELNLEIYKIDLSQVVSKYIGETEKNLKEVFQEARYSHAILFFDEMDALFGKRSEVKDSHDRYANLETAFLLQQMEEYEGITVLATNYLQNIDEAFMRRISYVIKFPFPDADYREKIWRSMFPEETPVCPDIDFKFLGDKLEIAGGNIKNIVLSSAFLAAGEGEPIGMKHLIRAARHELRKSGKILLKDDLGEYHGLLQAGKPGKGED